MELEVIELPNRITELLEKLNSPERLCRHLQIVYSTAYELIIRFKKEWPAISLDEELILFGAGTHDIGKTVIKAELYESGKEHEIIGPKILKENGCTTDESRFAFSHGNWLEAELVLEDLLVCLADKIWKGKRVDELEEKVGHLLSVKLKIDYWEIYGTLDEILEQISAGADQRLLWQNQ